MVSTIEYICMIVLVVTHLPYIFHCITVLAHCGANALRSSVHGIAVNVVHSLCTSSTPKFSGLLINNYKRLLFQIAEETQRVLRLALTELGLPKFYTLFGVAHNSSDLVSGPVWRTRAQTQTTTASGQTGQKLHVILLPSIPTRHSRPPYPRPNGH